MGLGELRDNVPAFLQFPFSVLRLHHGSENLFYSHFQRSRCRDCDVLRRTEGVLSPSRFKEGRHLATEDPHVDKRAQGIPSGCRPKTGLGRIDFPEKTVTLDLRRSLLA